MSSTYVPRSRPSSQHICLSTQVSFKHSSIIRLSPCNIHQHQHQPFCTLLSARKHFRDIVSLKRKTFRALPLHSFHLNLYPKVMEASSVTLPIACSLSPSYSIAYFLNLIPTSQHIYSTPAIDPVFNSELLITISIAKKSIIVASRDALSGRYSGKRRKRIPHLLRDC